MKKILLAGIVSCFALTSQAQDFNLGLRAGVNYATAKGDDAQNNSYRLGFVAGGIFNIGISDAISIQPELNYSSKGYKFENSNTTNTITTIERAKLNYLDVPVLLNVKAGGLFFEVGPQMSYILSAKQEDEIITVKGDEEKTVKSTSDISDNPHGVDFGYVAGIGYRMYSGIGIGLRYNGSIKDIYDEGPKANSNIRNSLFQLSLSYVTGW